MKKIAIVDSSTTAQSLYHLTYNKILNNHRLSQTPCTAALPFMYIVQYTRRHQEVAARGEIFEFRRVESN